MAAFTVTEYLNNPESERSATVDSDMFKSVTYQLGMSDNTDTQKKQLAILKDRTEQAIIEKQNALKRGLTREEKREVVKTMALEYPEVKTKGFFGETTKAQRGYQVTDPVGIVIPEADRLEITQRAQAAGVTIRNDAQWRDAYRELLAERQQKGT